MVATIDQIHPEMFRTILCESDVMGKVNTANGSCLSVANFRCVLKKLARLECYTDSQRMFARITGWMRRVKKKLHSSPFLHEENTFAKRVCGVLRRRVDRVTHHFALSKARKLIADFNIHYPDLQFRLLDIGARRGIEGRYDLLTKLRNFHVEGVEPDKKEAEVLMQRGPYQRVFPVAVADKAGDKTLYVTRVLGCTSIHEPNKENIQRYSISTWFDVQTKVELPVTTLDLLFDRGEKFDFISMDVQGAESEVMAGGERLMETTLGISLEVHFVEIYKGQKLFSSMHELLSERGFRMIRMGVGDFDGEIVEAECIYVKDQRLLRNKEEILKSILFALNWGNTAYVENLLRNAPLELFPLAEKNRILGLLKIVEKQKSEPWDDGLAAAEHRDGSGYF